MKKILLLLAFTSLHIQAQNDVALKYAAQIDSVSLQTIVTKLASDEFEGRGTGSKGSTRAASYISDFFVKNVVKAGNNGSYYQDIQAYNTKKASRYCWIDDFNFSENFTYDNLPLQDSIIKVNEIVFAGYGVSDISYNDFRNMDITGKGVMVLTGIGPKNKYGVRYDNSKTSNYPNQDYINLKKPKVLIKIRSGFDTFYAGSSSFINYYTGRNSNEIPTIEINELLANKILESSNTSVKQQMYNIEHDGEPAPFAINKELSFRGNYFSESAQAKNILAFVEGSDLKNEYIVLCAHYDHLGVRYNEIYYGADDNASGTSAVMEIARLLAKAKKEGKALRRSVVILLTTGEEAGLKGSEYYTQEPVYPLDKTVACVNIDMVGRIATKRQEAGNKYVYLSYHKQDSKNLEECVKRVNKNTTDLTIIDDVYPDSYNFFSRSDQYSFHLKKVPSLFFTSGEHNDYHTSRDKANLIDYAGLTERTKLAFLTVWELANTADFTSFQPHEN